MGEIPKDRIPNIIEMRDLAVFHQDAVFEFAGIAKDAGIADQDGTTDIRPRTDFHIVPDDGWPFDGRRIGDLHVLANQNIILKPFVSRDTILNQRLNIFF